MGRLFSNYAESQIKPDILTVLSIKLFHLGSDDDENVGQIGVKLIKEVYRLLPNLLLLLL